MENKKWSDFCDITMADSNQLHAVCLDTFPPCVYMNDTSHHIASLVNSYNQMKTQEDCLNDKVYYYIIAINFTSNKLMKSLF